MQSSIRQMFAFALAAAMTSCAPHDQTVPRRTAAMCKEGPPAWPASDGCRFMWRTWGPLHRKPRAVVVCVPGWNGTACDAEPLGRYLVGRDIQVYSTGVRGQHGDLAAASRRSKGDVDDGR